MYRALRRGRKYIEQLINSQSGLSETGLRALIKKGEGLQVEFKEAFPGNANDIAKEIVAFANTQGGTLLIGVKDNGEIIGIKEQLDSVVRRIAGIVRDNCEPSLSPEIGHTSVNGCHVVWVEVRKEKLPRSSSGRHYIRVGSTVRITTADELREMFTAKWWNRVDWKEIRERIIAMILSLFPGLGLVYRRRNLLGVIFFFATMIGYFTVLPGILIHVVGIILAGVLGKPARKNVPVYTNQNNLL